MVQENRLTVPALLAVLDERTQTILDKVSRMDGSLSETCIKLAKTDEIAQEAKKIALDACDKDCKTNNRIDSWVRATIVAAVGAIAAIVASIILLVRTKT